jgi:spoIIIJ-associated protein
MSENRSVEATGETIEEAIELGLEELQVSRESVIVEILEEPGRSFLGTSYAVVRLTTAARPRSELALNYDDDDDDGDEEAGYNRASLPTARRIPDDALPSDIRVGRDTLLELLKTMGFDVRVQVEESPVVDSEDEALILQIKGRDLRNLIGRHGETLDAIQYILRLMVSHKLHHRAHFIVDAAEYKTGRTTKLYLLANRMADQALARRRVVTMEPMPAHERRIIHMALRERTDVTTESIGEGRQRKVTIIPKNMKR